MYKRCRCFLLLLPWFCLAPAWGQATAPVTLPPTAVDSATAERTPASPMTEPNPLVPPIELAPTPVLRPGSVEQAQVSRTSTTEHTGTVEYFVERLRPYEPIYFVVGTERPNGKFQFSLRYQVFAGPDAPEGYLAPLAGLSFAYSQTSLWDLEADSKPFVDNSYRPEVMLHYDDVIDPERLGSGPLRHVGLQGGYQHESNGLAGPDSRSVNYLYVRPIFTFGSRDEGAGFIMVAPRLHAYVGGLAENPDIKKYRGYGDLRLIVGQGGGLQAAFIGRVGSDWRKGSVQLDLTYPLSRLFHGSADVYLTAQLFNGYGEGMIDFDQTSTTLRLGVSLIR